jgi:hypothetical protein
MNSKEKRIMLEYDSETEWSKKKKLNVKAIKKVNVRNTPVYETLKSKVYIKN